MAPSCFTDWDKPNLTLQTYWANPTVHVHYINSCQTQNCLQYYHILLLVRFWYTLNTLLRHCYHASLIYSSHGNHGFKLSTSFFVEFETHVRKSLWETKYLLLYSELLTESVEFSITPLFRCLHYLWNVTFTVRLQKTTLEHVLFIVHGNNIHINLLNIDC